MRALLDINVLLALFDADHAFHEKAHRWYARKSKQGWASSPLSENGFVRIFSHPNYHPLRKNSPSHAVDALSAFVANSDHQFWPDDLSLRDSTCFEPGRILCPRAITDAYLLALAMKHRGQLVTFDEGIRALSVVGAKPEHLCVLG